MVSILGTFNLWTQKWTSRRTEKSIVKTTLIRFQRLDPVLESCLFAHFATFLPEMPRIAHLPAKLCFQNIRSKNSKLNALLSVNDADPGTDKLKDNIANKIHSECSSHIHKKYKSPYDASCLVKLHTIAHIAGVATRDEFGMGSSGIHSPLTPNTNHVWYFNN